MKILYLDDEIDLLDIFKETFESDSVSVSVISNPDEAIKMAQKGHFDAIFLDYRMPGTTGDEVARKMGLTVPIYLVTGDTTVETQYKFTKVLSKPTDVNQILEILKASK